MVRQARRADLLDVFRIEQSAFPQPWPFAAFERFVGQPGFLVAETATGDVAGYVVADTVPNHGRRLGHIKDIAVQRNHQEEGLGTLLLRRALGVLRSRGTSAVKLEVRRSNEAARELYGNHGFTHRRTVPRYYDDGEDALVMMRELE
jgi:ribosomal-protein-alanine N-acetyltransferase